MPLWLYHLLVLEVIISTAFEISPVINTYGPVLGNYSS